MSKQLRNSCLWVLVLVLIFFSLPTSISAAPKTDSAPVPIHSEYPGEDAFTEESNKKAIKQLEWLLFEAGYLKKRDGKFTKTDEKAVRSFQKELVDKAEIDKKIKAQIQDEEQGIPGEATWEQLVLISNGAYPTERSYVKGESNVPIYRMEYLLHAVGMLDKKHINGKLTSADIKAGQKYQLTKGWTKKTAWGIPGPKTWGFLTEDYMDKHPLPEFEVDEKNNEVKKLRKLLQAAGWKSEGTGNRFTEEDQEAVQAFQEAQGWDEEEATGIPDEKTWTYLHIGSLGIGKSDTKTTKKDKTKEDKKAKKENKKTSSSKKNDKCAVAKDRGYNVQKVLTVKATAYGIDGNGIWGPVDSLGNPLHVGKSLNHVQKKDSDFRTIAIDPRVIPKGSKVYVTGYHTMGLSIPKGGFIGKATDVGGAIKNHHIDIFVNTTEKKVAPFGVQQGVTVCVLKKK